MKSGHKIIIAGIVAAGLLAVAAPPALRYLHSQRFDDLVQKWSCDDMDHDMYFYPQYVFNPEKYDKGKLQLYTPFPYEPKEWAELYDIDENGVVRVYREKEDLYFYNTVTIAQLALANFKQYQDTKKPAFKKAFLANADYLKKHYKAVGPDEIAYPYEFAHGRLKPGWYSAMAQGQVLSVLALEYKLTKDTVLLDHMRKVKNFMLRPIDKGGTLTTTPEGGPWLEEYAMLPADYVLNGAVAALMGLYDYKSVIPDDRQVNEIFPKLVEAIKLSVPHYDTGRWVNYDRRNHFAIDYRYIEAQTLQMYQMYEITGDPFFLDFYHRWGRYYRICVVDRFLK
jgi:heparosan-N-sulfate-glucuronate 5-epimerase